MEELEIKRKLIAEALNRKEQEITDEDIEKLNKYITINQCCVGLDEGKYFYWYLDCDDEPKEAVATLDGEIIKVDDTTKFFGIK